MSGSRATRSRASEEIWLIDGSMKSLKIASEHRFQSTQGIGSKTRLDGTVHGIDRTALR